MKMKIFSKFSFLSTSSHRDSLHPLSIVLCIAAASALVAPLLSKAAAVASVSPLFSPAHYRPIHIHIYI